MELLNEEEFNNIEECLNNPLILLRPLGRYNNLSVCEQLWIHARRTDICIVKPLDGYNVSYKIMLRAGCINDNFEMVFEGNDHDIFISFMNSLCNHLINDGR
jgi:hypothetical protein